MADAVFDSFMIHAYQAYREDDAVGVLKLPTVDYDPISSGNCWTKALSADTQQAIAGQVYDATHKMYVVGTATLQEGDAVVISGAGRLNGSYLVVGVEPYPDESGVHHLTCFMKRQVVTITD